MSNGQVCDPDWGCEHHNVAGPPVGNIRACRVSVSDVGKLAHELTKAVVDTSWMAALDQGARRSYEKSVAETTALLVEIFNAAAQLPAAGSIKEDFGELMVSMGASRALNQLFGHFEVPLAELWNPRVKNNGGFDFHTVCPDERVHFGEAKYSSSKSPYALAIDQIANFLEAEKHFRDRPHLLSLVKPSAISNLDADDFGVVAAFSINAVNPEQIVKNAINKAVELAGAHKITRIFLVGVTYDA